MFEQIFQRAIRIVKFDVAVYNEIEKDEGATQEAWLIVIITSLLAAIGAGVAATAIPQAGGSFFGTFVGSLISGIVGWLLWSLVTWFIGTRLFQGQATYWELARTLGYASAPKILGLLAIVPCLGAIAGIVGAVLSLIAGFFAVREALDLTTEKAIFTILIGWAIVFVLSLLLAGIFF
jgi:hypothetical protein